MTDVGDLYLLQDGTQADPGDCSKGDDGVLRHANGLAVVLNADGTPQTIGAAAVDNKNVEAANAGKDEAVEQAVAEPQPAEAEKPAAEPRAASEQPHAAASRRAKSED